MSFLERRHGLVFVLLIGYACSTAYAEPQAGTPRLTDVWSSYRCDQSSAAAGLEILVSIAGRSPGLNVDPGCFAVVFRDHDPRSVQELEGVGRRLAVNISEFVPFRNTSNIHSVELPGGRLMVCGTTYEWGKPVAFCTK